MSWEGYLQSSGQVSRSHKLRNFLIRSTGDVDARLLYVWEDLGEFCATATLAFLTRRKLLPSFFRDCILSVPYRLLYLDYSDTSENRGGNQHQLGGPVQEAVKLGMLAFASMIFVQISGVEMRFAYLAEKTQKTLVALQKPSKDDRLGWEIRTWLLLVSGISLFQFQRRDWLDTCLAECLQVLSLSSWSKTSLVLRGWLWIERLQDEIGKGVYEDCLRVPQPSYQPDSEI